MIEFNGYIFDAYALFIYLSVLIITMYFLRKNGFSLIQNIWLSFLTISFLDIFWEIEHNILTSIKGNIFIYPVILRMIFLLFPCFLWFYYNKRFCYSYSVLFLIPLIVEYILYFNIHPYGTVINRVLFSGTTLYYIRYWKISRS